MSQNNICCALCGGAASASCAKCKAVRYCSAKCQRADWAAHKAACARAAAADPLVNNDRAGAARELASPPVVPDTTHVLLSGPVMPTIVNRLWFYPFGNTIARDVLASVPPPDARARAVPGDPGVAARVLLLGCGDWRYIFHSLHSRWPAAAAAASPAAAVVHFVVNDNEAAIMARNILICWLFLDAESSCLDDAAARRGPGAAAAAATRMARLWALFYNAFVDAATLALAGRASTALLAASGDAARWDATPLGHIIRVTVDSWVGIRRIWAAYAAAADAAGGSEAAVAADAAAYRAARAGTLRGTILETGVPMPRCATVGGIPMGNSKLYGPAMRAYAESGVMDIFGVLCAGAAGAGGPPSRVNPLLRYTHQNGATPCAHYAGFPLEGFHYLEAGNAAALAPGEPFSDPAAFPCALACAAADGAPRDSHAFERMALRACLMEWAAWAAAFRAAAPHRLRIMVIVADAIDCCDALAASGGGPLRAWMPCGAPALALPYLGGQRAVEFDVVDLSNLCDHFGGLNLLPGALKLLHPTARHGRLCADVIVQAADATGSGGGFEAAASERMLLMTPSVAGLLLGVVGDSAMSAYSARATWMLGFAAAVGYQMIVRVGWRRVDAGGGCDSGDGDGDGPAVSVPRAVLAPDELAGLLVPVFDRMFPHSEAGGFAQRLRVAPPARAPPLTRAEAEAMRRGLSTRDVYTPISFARLVYYVCVERLRLQAAASGHADAIRDAFGGGGRSHSTARGALLCEAELHVRLLDGVGCEDGSAGVARYAVALSREEAPYFWGPEVLATPTVAACINCGPTPARFTPHFLYVAAACGGDGATAAAAAGSDDAGGGDAAGVVSVGSTAYRVVPGGRVDRASSHVVVSFLAPTSLKPAADTTVSLLLTTPWMYDRWGRADTLFEAPLCGAGGRVSVTRGVCLWPHAPDLPPAFGWGSRRAAAGGVGASAAAAGAQPLACNEVSVVLAPRPRALLSPPVPFGGPRRRGGGGGDGGGGVEDTRVPLSDVARLVATVECTGAAARALAAGGGGGAPAATVSLARGACFRSVRVRVRGGGGGGGSGGGDGSEWVLEVQFPLPVRLATARAEVSRARGTISLAAEPMLGFDGAAPPGELPDDLFGPLHALPTLNLASLPLISSAGAAAAEWMRVAGATVSGRERSVRNAPGHPLVELKESLHCITAHVCGKFIPETDGLGPERSAAHKFFHLFDSTGDLGILGVLLARELRYDVSQSSLVLDAFVCMMTTENVRVAGPAVRILERRLRGAVSVNVSASEVRLWKRLLVACCDRASDCVHGSGCERPRPGPLSLETGGRVFCACVLGRGGVVPELAAFGVPAAAAAHFVRVALPFLFGSVECGISFADSAAPAGAGAAAAPSAPTPRAAASGSSTAVCGGCGRHGAELLCGRCHEARYCDRECQRAAWKAGHKGACSGARSSSGSSSGTGPKGVA